MWFMCLSFGRVTGMTGMTRTVYGRLVTDKVIKKPVMCLNGCSRVVQNQLCVVMVTHVSGWLLTCRAKQTYNELFSS